MATAPFTISRCLKTYLDVSSWCLSVLKHQAKPTFGSFILQLHALVIYLVGASVAHLSTLSIMYPVLLHQLGQTSISKCVKKQRIIFIYSNPTYRSTFRPFFGGAAPIASLDGEIFGRSWLQPFILTEHVYWSQTEWPEHVLQMCHEYSAKDLLLLRLSGKHWSVSLSAVQILEI